MTMRTLSDDFGTTYRLSPTDVYFEQTVAFRASPSIVKRSGLLSKKWKTGRLICMEQGIEGAYIAHNLHCTPHCMEPRSRRLEILDLARKQKGLLDIKVMNENEHAQIEGLVCIGPNSKVYQDIVTHNSERLCLAEVKTELLSMIHEKKVHDRGNVSIGCGYASQNYQKDAFGMFAPSITLSTTKERVQQMCAVSDIIRDMCLSMEMVCPFTNNNERTQRFANALCSNFDLPTKNVRGEPANIIEHMTFALTSGDQRNRIMFGSHVDSMNCRCDGWNQVFVMYHHFVDSEVVYRLCLIAYSRSVINSYFLRYVWSCGVEV